MENLTFKSKSIYKTVIILTTNYTCDCARICLLTCRTNKHMLLFPAQVCHNAAYNNLTMISDKSG